MRRVRGLLPNKRSFVTECCSRVTVVVLASGDREGACVSSCSDYRPATVR